jgi:hypothetical protein
LENQIVSWSKLMWHGFKLVLVRVNQFA